MRKRNITIVLIVAAILASFMYGWIEYHRQSKNLSDVKAAYHSDAAQLISEFDSNASAAEKKYLGNVVEVNGKIRQVEKDADGHYVIVIGGADNMSAVRCSMDSSIRDEIAGLQEGADVTVKGNFTGYQKDDTGLLGSDIQLNRSVLVKSD